MPLLVSPFRAERMDYGPMNPAAIVLFSDPRAKRAVSEARLQSLFGLTSAEARLAAALVGGKGLAEYASTTGISINTAKTQMRQVFEKAGVNRQTDLVRAVAANPVLTYDPNRFD